MAQSEIDFLFGVKLSYGSAEFGVSREKGGYWQGPLKDENSDKASTNGNNIIYHGFNKKDNIRNYIKSNVDVFNNSDVNPYLELLRKINELNIASLKINSQDLAYLKDLGVYPVNKMFVLRRFDDFVGVPVNLIDLPVQPKSVIVGWIKSDKEASKLLSIGFNEQWSTHNDMLPTTMKKILENEFGVKLDSKFLGKKWTQSLLFGFLKNAGIVSDDFSILNLPFGDPNVLAETPIREGTQPGDDGDITYGLESKFNMQLDTTYEQKLINGIDPIMAFNDIMNNIMYMGTQNVKYIGNPDAPLFHSIQNVSNTAQNSPSGLISAWTEVIKDMFDAFITAIKETAEDLLETAKKVVGAAGELITNPSEGFKKLAEIGSVLLVPSMQKYKWPLFASVGVMTGIATSPWHLTIGNPLSPILSINNIIVSVDMELSNELAFNDFPKEIKVMLEIRQGRNYGAQEILSFFNNGYYRKYSAPKFDKSEEQNEIDKLNQQLKVDVPQK